MIRVAVTGGAGAGKTVVCERFQRHKLRDLITKDTEARKTLERLTHPEIVGLLEKKLAAMASRRENDVVVVEAPLLIEVGMQDRFDVVILVEASPELQKSRLVARNGSSDASAAALLDIQMTSEEKRPYADYVVDNRGTLDGLEGPVKEIYEKIIKGDQKGLTC
jgi:dephospho-CoA kinase